MTGGMTIDPRAFSPIWRAYIAEHYGLSTRCIDDFVNGVALTAIECATGIAIFGGVTYDVEWAVPDGERDGAIILRATVQYVFPHVNSHVSALAHGARRRRVEALFRHVTRIDGISGKEQRSLCCDVHWHSVDREEYESSLWRAVR